MKGCMMINDFGPDRIIWSADVKAKELEEVIKSKALPEGTIIKLDRLFFEKYEKSYIDLCQDNGYPVFVDAKIVEIPSKVLEIAKIYLDYRPWMLNVMAGAASTGVTNRSFTRREEEIDCLMRFAELCDMYGTRSCAVTVLTTKTPDLCVQEFRRGPEGQVKTYVKMLDFAGMTDIVCSPNEIKLIRKKMGITDLDINTPGVRLPESATDDQARIATPHKAFSDGATRIIVGRPLTGTDEQGPLVERIGINYNRIIENIQIGK